MKISNATKVSLFAILAFTVLLTSSCKKLDNLVKVNLELQMAQVPFTIDASAAGTTANTGTVHFDVDSAIKANNASFGVGNIKSATIDSVVVTLTDSTFSGVTNASASFYSDAVLTPVTIAGSNTGSTSSILTLSSSTTADLTSYLKATSFTYTFTCTHPQVLTPIPASAVAYFHLVVEPN